MDKIDNESSIDLNESSDVSDLINDFKMGRSKTKNKIDSSLSADEEFLEESGKQ